ncbi:hypothetical protein C8F04DRAFT_1244092 [Mycena alexandri]|uniref:Uncharacterized protein n=1 Tax=Mycena alexandri TaxID=1745969 RepID=A0AAD6WLY4_9AGAR|nr:hypothetical protein C8F04DRAFT_1244092 [Mycena alexandri]
MTPGASGSKSHRRYSATAPHTDFDMSIHVDPDPPAQNNRGQSQEAPLDVPMNEDEPPVNDGNNILNPATDFAQDNLPPIGPTAGLQDDVDMPRAPSPTDNPGVQPDLTVRVEDFQITNHFINALRDARLDDPAENLDPDIIEQIRNPPQNPPTLTPDERLSIDLFLSITNASEQTYHSVRDAILRRHPDDNILSYYTVKKLISELSGVVYVTRDMCPDSCIAYTGPFAQLLSCAICGIPRYDPKHEAAQVPRLQFNTILIGPLLQALRRSIQGATDLLYRERLTKAILDDLEENDEAGGSHYYPVRFKPDHYAVPGSNHPDIHLGPLLDEFDSQEAAARYTENVLHVGAAANTAQFEARRLETGICKPSIFSGLPAEHMLGVPDCFGLDFMHAPALNFTDLLIPLWRGTFDRDKSDSKDSWDWAVLTGETWKRHGQAVADCTRYMPGSFDRPPRNPAQKINSGYKAWEFLLYFFGVGPALLYGILPEKYWLNYCKSVRGIRILLQEEITPTELLEAHELLSEWSDEFEQLYVQRRADRIHFVRPVVHTVSHMPPETVRKGPGNIYAQWGLERTIGNLGEEIRQHSNPYANLSQRTIHRAWVNSLKTIIPDLEPDSVVLPRGSVDIGKGYALLRRQDSCSRSVRPCEEEAVRKYMEEEFDEEAAQDWRPSVVRWARARLPNGHTARSLWNEGGREELRIARAVKVQVAEDEDCEIAEVLFFCILNFQDEERYIAVASFFGPPDPHLLKISNKVYWSASHLRESDVRAIEITSIISCVMMAPDEQYRHLRADGSEVDRWFLTEKPTLKLACWIGSADPMDEE